MNEKEKRNELNSFYSRRKLENMFFSSHGGKHYHLKVIWKEAERSSHRSVNARFYCMALRVASRRHRIRVGSGCVHFLNSADSVLLRSWY